MSKEKKTVIAAVAVFLCLCLTCASVIVLRKNRKNPPAKTQGQTGTSESNSQSLPESSNTSETESVTETAPESNTEKESTTKKQEKPTKKPDNKPTKPKPTEPKSTEPKSTKPYNPDDNYNVSHEIAGSLPKREAVSGSWFDDAVFVGDSVSLKLTMYESSVDRLGKAQFLTAGSLSATNALWDVSEKSVHPKYKGKKQKIEDSIAQMSGVKKVYIMLGMNDINAVGINGGIKNLEKLCNNILKKSPDVQIYIQSVTPMAKGSNVASSKEGKLNNKSIREYNKKLASLAQKRGWYFVNVSEVMYDGNGYLKNEYCGDLGTMGIHFSNAGCKAWIDYLLTHTPEDIYHRVENS